MNPTELINGYEYRDGRLVSAKVSRIVEAIKDYEPNLDVQWIPPEARQGNQSAFVITYSPVGGRPYALFHVKTEEEFDERVLRKIIANDQRNGQVKVSDFEAWERSRELVARQEWRDQVEQMNELAASILKSNKSKYKVNDNLVISADSPVNVAHRV